MAGVDGEDDEEEERAMMVTAGFTDLKGEASGFFEEVEEVERRRRWAMPANEDTVDDDALAEEAPLAAQATFACRGVQQRDTRMVARVRFV